MTVKLFQHDFFQWRDARVESAAIPVRQLKLAEITDQKIDTLIKQAVDSPHLVVPRLDPDSKHAIRESATHLRVMIPFVGNKTLFELAPTQMSITSESVQISDRELSVRMRDDSRLESDLSVLLSDIQGNLNNLENDLNNLKIMIAQHVRQVAANRKTELQAIADRDSTRSFPIR